MNWLRAQPNSNGKSASSGLARAAGTTVMVASKVKGFDAAVDLWGGGVVQEPTTSSPSPRST